MMACHKDSSDVNPADPPDKTVNASLQGRVLDENGLPVAGAAVTSGKDVTTTDINGVFRLNNIQMSGRWGFVKVVKPGYFTGSRTILTHADATNFIQIDLLPKVGIGNFSAAAGGELKLPSGPSLSFIANSIVNTAGNVAYTGNVHVFASYLDPTDENINKRMPGDLRGISAAGRETGLQTFGMMAVELEGDGGEKLQLAAGKKATITMTIPVSLQAAAPATIPLWHFNDTTGKWMEEGSAARSGSNYIGQVGHFSYWNWDYPCGIVFFQLNLKDQHGNPIAYGNVQFQSDNYGTQGGQTDSVGHTQGWLIKGGTYTMRIKDDCGNTLYTQKVGPALTDQNLGTLTVSLSKASITLTGKVVDCSQSPVAHGYVNAFVDGLNYRAEVTNGSFTFSLNRCSDLPTDIKLVATDNATSLQGAVSTITAATGTIDIGTLAACGAKSEQYINFILKGKSYTVQSPGDSMKIIVNGQIYQLVGGGDEGRPTAILLMHDLNKAGTYTPSLVVVDDGQSSYYSIQSSNTCTITAFGEIYGTIEGNFSTTVRLQEDTTATYPVTGNFKLKRTY